MWLKNLVLAHPPIDCENVVRRIGKGRDRAGRNPAGGNAEEVCCRWEHRRGVLKVVQCAIEMGTETF